MSEFSNQVDSEEGASLSSPSLLGMTVRRLRMHRKMSQADLARTADVKESVISRIESGKTRALHAHNLKSIADALQVKFSYMRELAYGRPPALPEEIWDKYTRVTEEPVTPVSKRQAYLELLDLVLNESDERIKQEANLLLRQVANWVPCEPENGQKQGVTVENQMPTDWQEQVKRLLESRSTTNRPMPLSLPEENPTDAL